MKSMRRLLNAQELALKAAIVVPSVSHYRLPSDTDHAPVLNVITLQCFEIRGKLAP